MDGSLADGHSISAVTLISSATDTTTDSGTITPDNIVIEDADGSIVTDNYSITPQNGVLTVTAEIEAKVTAAPKASAITYGQTLKNSTLTGGTGNVAGTFAWADNTTPPAVSDSNKTEYDVVFTPTDTKYSSVTCKVKVTVNRKRVTITGLTASDKEYDGTTEAAVTGMVDIVGRLDGDDVAVSAGTAAFADADAGENKDVTFSGWSLTGAASGNYYLHEQPATVKATIAPKSITGATVTLNKTRFEYNGSEQSVSVTKVTLTNGTVLGTGDYAVSGDTSGTAKNTYTVTVKGKGNYKDEATATWIISDKLMTVNAPNVNATYDGAAHGIIVNVTDPSSGYTIKYGDSEDSCTQDKSPTITNVSDSGKTVYFRITATNYEDYTGSATITIRKKPVKKVSGIKAENKDYDGNKTATLDCTDVKFDGETVVGLSVAAAGEFADADAGKNKTVNISILDLQGTSAPNYELAESGKQTTTTADISKVNIPADSITASEVITGLTYEGAALALVTGGTIAGKIGTMWYTVTDGTATTAPEFDGDSEASDKKWSTSVPTAINAGTYYVWYKAKGDENHLDSAVAGPVTVTVSKKAVTVTANEQTVKEGGAIATGADNAKLDGAAEGHKLADLKLASSSTAAATTEGEITPSDAVIKDADGTDVTGNYEITYVKGKLTVTSEQKEPVQQDEGSIKTDAHVDEKAPETRVENLTPELAKSLLTEEEIKQLEEGATVLLYLDVKNIDETVSAEDKDLTEGKAKEISGGAKVGMYLDLSLFKKVGNNDSVKVTDTNGQKVRAVFEVPENLRGGADVIRTFYIARIHDGKIEILAQSTDTSIPVDSDLFSTYSLLYSDQPVYEGFIDRVYGVLLGRKVDPAGLTSWKEALEKKEITAAQVIEGVIYSSEYLANNKGELNKADSNDVFVDKMYLAILNRKGDDEGKKIWLNLLDQGYSRKYVLAQFVNSAEFDKFCADSGYNRG